MDEETAALAADIVRVATARGVTIAVAESLTGGDVVSALVDVPGASAVVRGAVVAYATDLKAAILGVDPTLLAEMVEVANALAAEHADGDFRLIFNNGANAGQTVFHVHAHVLAGGLTEGSL